MSEYIFKKYDYQSIISNHTHRSLNKFIQEISNGV